MSSVPFTSNHS